MSLLQKNSKIRLLFILTLAMALNIQCFAQKKIKIKSVEGTAYVTDNITLHQAEQNALNEAKKEALKKAGVSEDITSTNMLNTSQIHDVVKQNFVEISTSSLNGAILNYSIINEKKSVDEFNNFKIDLTIDATVIKYKEKKDPSFIFTVSGIKDVYYTGDTLSFFFRPYQDGYLKIFLISTDTSQIIYPYIDYEYSKFRDEQDRLFKKGVSVRFPILKYIKYSLTCTNKKSFEFNQLIFVFLKKNIPFTKKLTTKNIHEWIYSIPPNFRSVQNVIFKIENNK